MPLALREVAEFVGGHSMADVDNVTFTQNYPRSFPELLLS